MKNKKLTVGNNKPVGEKDSLLKKYFSGEKLDILMSGEDEPSSIKCENKKDYIQKLSDFFQGTKEIFLLAGELDPDFYEGIINSNKMLFEEGSVNIIAGPYIAVKDDSFLEYYDVRNDKLESWWFAEGKADWLKAHPVFKKAQKNSKIKIYITKRRCPRHFCISRDAKMLYVESTHDELETSEGGLLYRNERLMNIFLELWSAIKECICHEVDKSTKPERARLKPCSIFGKEKDWKGKIKKEFSKSLKQDSSFV